jgi:hypothetical protein
MNIKPHFGFGRVKFGLSEKEVTKMLGKPSIRESELELGEPEDITMEYEAHGVDLTFSADDDFKLGAMTFYGNSHELFGMNFIGIGETKLLKYAKQTGIHDLVLDEDSEEPLDKNYTSDAFCLLFWIQEGIVDSISILPEYAENGNDIIWPA